MATTLLNPGCDTCYNCGEDCDRCTNFYDPDEWYARICDLHPYNTGYANRIDPNGGGTSWFWGTHSLDTDIMGVLFNWQFALTEPYSVVGDVRKYRSAWMSVPALNRTIVRYFGPTASAEGSYSSRNYDFDDFQFRITIIEECGLFEVEVDGKYRVRYSVGGGSPETAGGTMNASFTPPGSEAACNELGIATIGSVSDITSGLGFFVANPPITFSLDASPKTIAAANNALIACGGS